MPRRKKPKAPKSQWAFYGACVVCGAPFLIHEHDDPVVAPEVMQSCLCRPMAVFAAQLGEHFHMHNI